MRKQNPFNINSRREIFLFLFILILGLIYVRFTWIRIENEQIDHTLQIARSLVATLPKEDLKMLEAKPEDVDKPQYRVFKNMLREIIRVNHKARFAYIYIEQNGKLYFIADSEPENSPDYSPPGQEYTEAKSEDKQPFRDGKELVTAPLSDRWGTWISVFIPIKDKVTGKTMAVFGMDFNSKSWNNSLFFEVIQSSALIVLLLLTFLFLFKIKGTIKLLKIEITDRKQAEKTLQESEEKYRLIFEYTPVGLLSFDENGAVVACNDHFVEIIGSSRQKLIGLNMLNLPDKKLVASVQNALNGNIALYEDVYQAVTSKKNSPVRALFAPMGVENGNGRGGVGIIEDITERKQAEEALAQSQERARLQRNAIARIAGDEVIAFGDLTVSFQRLTEEVAVAMRVERASIWLFSDDKTVMQCISLFENRSKKHSSGAVLKYEDYPDYFEAINHESRISAADAQNDPRTSGFTAGYLVPLGIRSMLDAGIHVEGDLKGVICLEHINEMRTWHSDEESFASTVASIVAQTLANNKRKEADEALKEALIKAESGNRLKTAFMNNISHEVRTPLNGILGFSNLIIQPNIPDEEKAQYYSLIKTSSSRLLDTITNYMDISLIASGNMEVKINPIDLHMVLHQLLDQYEPMCAEKNLKLKLEIPGNAVSISLCSDAELFCKVFSHLLDNAVKFTNQGQITFGCTSETACLPDGPCEITFFVKDTGIGIKMESLQLIFESFKQEDISRTRGFEGSGLGLSIAQGLVHLLGGEIHLTSEKGSGSTFTFTLPCGEMEHGPDTEEKSNRVPKVEKPVILIAEDDESNLLYLESILKKKDTAIISVLNGEEAVDQCREHPEISLVLMDLKMPVMDGLEATREIKTFRKTLPIIALTAFGMSGDEKRVIEAGCDSYLSKPVTREMLLKKLEQYGIGL